MSEAVSEGWVSFRRRAGDRANFLDELGDANGDGKGGFPTRRNEAWHYTPLQSLGKTVWKAPAPMSVEKASRLLDALVLPEADGRLVFGNGYELPDLSSLPSGLVRAEASSPESPSALSEELKNCFSAHLNAALNRESVSLRVPKGVDAGLLEIVSLHDGGEGSSHLRFEIVLEEGAVLRLLDVQAGEGVYLANPVMTAVCAEGARFVHVKRQAESAEAVHLGLVGVNVEEKGVYESFTLNQGSLLGRHEVMCALTGAQATAHVNAMQIVDGARLNDLTSRIRHRAPDGVSRQTVRSVLSDESTGVFQGKILVERAAQKTDGYQMNQALLLSEGAQINSKPELEIYADDVKCSHGATVGALDEEQLFFLRARGIPAPQARAILVEAFCRETLDLLEDEVLRAYLSKPLSLSPTSSKTFEAKEKSMAEGETL